MGSLLLMCAEVHHDKPSHSLQDVALPCQQKPCARQQACYLPDFSYLSVLDLLLRPRLLWHFRPIPWSLMLRAWFSTAAINGLFIPQHICLSACEIVADGTNMTNSNPDIVRGGRLHLLGLPAELQTMIFDLAYQRPADVELIPASEWHREQSSRRQRTSCSGFNYSSRFRPKVCDSLISKQYFVPAARSYAQSQRLETGLHNRSPYFSMHDGILAAFSRDVVGNYSMIGFWSLASVRSLRLTVRLSDFEVEVEHEVELPMLKQRLTAESFARSQLASRLAHVHGVTHVELVPEELEGYFTEEEKSNLRVNVKMLETVVKQTTSKPEAEIVVAEDGKARLTPLYASSKVFFESVEEQAALKSDFQASFIEVITYWLSDMTGAEESKVETMVHDLLKDLRGNQNSSEAAVYTVQNGSGHAVQPARKLRAAAKHICEEEQLVTDSAFGKLVDGEDNTDNDIVPRAVEWQSIEQMTQETNASMRLAVQRLAIIGQRVAESEEAFGNLPAIDLKSLISCGRSAKSS